MSQKMINVELTVLGETDVLVFHLDSEKPEEYCVNLNSPKSQADLKKVFLKLLELLMVDNIKLDLTIASEYSKGLYKEVCAEYINELNNELIQVKENIENELL